MKNHRPPFLARLMLAGLLALIPATAWAGPGAAAAPELALCSRFKASAVAWVTLDENGDIDRQVSAYPAETILITPVFEYNCVPKGGVTVVTVFTLNGETVYTDKETLKAASRKGVYGYPLSSETPFDDGEWGVQFYNDKSLLAESTVTVGGDASQPSGLVAVEGRVTAKQTGKAIKNAVVLILQPGVTVQAWLDGGRKDGDIFTAGKTDASGRFALTSALQRNQPYSIVVAASGYRATGRDNFVIDDSAPDPLALNITMTR